MYLQVLYSVLAETQFISSSCGQKLSCNISSRTSSLSHSSEKLPVYKHKGAFVTF